MAVSEQLSIDEAIRQRESAVRRVDEAADRHWADVALETIRQVARRQPTVHSDDLHVYMAEHHPDVRTHEPRAWGPVTRRAVARGWIVPTDTYRPSARPSTHRNPKRVYRSRLYREQF